MKVVLGSTEWRASRDKWLASLPQYRANRASQAAAPKPSPKAAVQKAQPSTPQKKENIMSSKIDLNERVRTEAFRCLASLPPAEHAAKITEIMSRYPVMLDDASKATPPDVLARMDSVFNTVSLPRIKHEAHRSIYRVVAPQRPVIRVS